MPQAQDWEEGSLPQLVTFWLADVSGRRPAVALSFGRPGRDRVSGSAPPAGLLANLQFDLA